MARGIQPPQDVPRANRAGLSLPLNTLAIPTPFFSTPDRETVEQGGEALFHFFVEEELASAGLTEHVFPNEVDGGGDVARAGPSVSTPDGYKNSFLAQHGRDLRDLADQFSRSRENVQVRTQADSVNLSDITREGFLDLLQELFHDGFSRERLIALFFFCLYLIIRAINEKREQLFQGLFLWSLQYIKNNVCKWVYEHGGWGRVLGNIYDIIFKVAVVGALGVAIVAGLVWIRNNLR